MRSLYVMYRVPGTQTSYSVGLITRDDSGEYHFKYYYDTRKGSMWDRAVEAGFVIFPDLPDKNRLYHNGCLFAPFKSRIPARDDKNIPVFLEVLKLKQYDELDFLINFGLSKYDTISFKESWYTHAVD